MSPATSKTDHRRRLIFQRVDIEGTGWFNNTLLDDVTAWCNVDGDNKMRAVDSVMGE